MRIKTILILLVIVIITSLIIIPKYLEKNKYNIHDAYIVSNEKEIPLYDEAKTEIKKANRGQKVNIIGETEEYDIIKIDNEKYLIKKENIGAYEEIVKEETMAVRTSTIIYENALDNKIESFVKKGEIVNIIGFNKVDDSGNVDMYKIKYNDKTGYIYGKYLLSDKEEALKNYDKGYYTVHAKRTNTLGGGSAANLDYYPYEKPNFEENKMPTEVRSLYINTNALKNIDAYIEYAKETNINAFVVDIKDNTSPSYKSDVMKTYSITNYNKARYEVEEYQKLIKKIKDSGFYVIGRITTFKDDYYAIDNKEETIIDKRVGETFNHNGSLWPSAYSRKVWEFNVSLAVEAVKLMGFNEIQFDYVRFPDKTSSIEEYLDYKNKYDEEKAQAIQNFVMYACDELHKEKVYVSIDVFAESAHTYVTGYGQYFPSISNIADVISAMPYPDHFNYNQYSITDKAVWEEPYKLLNHWAKEYVSKRQLETTTPAKVRTWIQGYDTIRKPYITYDETKIEEQIKGLYDANLNAGFIIWNSESNLEKLKKFKKALDKDYKETNYE